MDKERLNNMIWWFCFLGMGLLCISLVVGSKAILEANLSDITQGDMSVFVSGTLLSLGIMFGIILMFAWDGRALEKRLKALEELHRTELAAKAMVGMATGIAIGAMVISEVGKQERIKFVPPSRSGRSPGMKMIDDLNKTKDFQRMVRIGGYQEKKKKKVKKKCKK